MRWQIKIGSNWAPGRCAKSIKGKNRKGQNSLMELSKKVELSGRKLRKLQLNPLEMLVETDRICRKYQIKYSLDGGTLLGAVRHQGFIPWDDDIDIVMHRREYRKFYRACKKELDRSRFFLQEYRTDPHYRWGYAKLRRLGTEFVRLGQGHLKNRTGVFMDIFVVDNVPDGWLARRAHFMACFTIRKLLYAQLGMANEQFLLMRLFYKMCYDTIPRDAIFQFRNRIAGACNRKKTRLVAHMTYPYPKRAKYGMPASCFEEMVDMEFEGRKFLCFKGYRTYLALLFGDYLALPPEGERVAHLDASKIQLLDPKDLFCREELVRLGWIVPGSL